MAPASWQLDKSRFSTEALQPTHDGWQPPLDFFRVYQLELDVADVAVVRAALEGVKSHLRQVKTFSRGVQVLNRHQDDAAAILLDPVRRAQHRGEVEARRATLVEQLRFRIGGGPGLPSAEIGRIATASRHEQTAAAVRQACVAAGGVVRDPVEVPIDGQPGEWTDLLGQLALLQYAPGHSPSLWNYLSDTKGLNGLATDRQALDARRPVLRTKRDDSRPAEEAVIAFALKRIAAGTLREILRFEVLDQLLRACASGYREVVAAATGLAGRLGPLGLPGPEPLAYAAWCAQRFPDPVAAWSGTVQARLGDRDLRGALTLLDAQPELPQSWQKRREELRESLARLDAELAEIRGLERRDPEAAVERALSAQREFSDEALRAVLERCPPAPPPSGSSHVEDAAVALQWQPSPSRAGRITYRVVRATGPRAPGPGEGTTIADDLGAHQVRDPQPPPGKELTYAVFALRDGVAAEESCVIRAGLVLPQVQDAELVPDVQGVRARWRSPAGAAGVRVTRTGDGGTHRVSEVSDDGFVDRTARAGPRYEYRVQVDYRLPDGTLRAGQGVLLAGGREPTPEPVIDLRVDDGDDNELDLRWSPPPSGTVEIFLTEKAQVLADGVQPRTALPTMDRLPVSDIAATGPGRLRAPVPEHLRTYWLVPVTVLGRFAAPGRPVKVERSLPGVRGLSAELLGTQVRLRWEWPRGADEVWVTWRPDRRPEGIDDPAAHRRLVTRSGYDSAGFRVLELGSECWFGVATTTLVAGRRVTGALRFVHTGAARQARFRIERRRRSLFGGNRAPGTHTVEVSWEQPDPLPAVELRVKNTTRPRNRADGERLIRLDGGPSPLVAGFSLPPGMARPYVGVFAEDPAVLIVPGAGADSGELR